MRGERIREDYLRILRFFRLTAEYARRPARRRRRSPPACSSATVSARLSAERVRQELLRLLVAPRGPELVRWMLYYGLLPPVLASAPRPTLLERLAALETALAAEPDAIPRLAALAVEVPEDADRLADRLRLANDERARLAQMAMHTPDVSPSAPETAARAYLYAEGAAAYRDRLLIAWARSTDRGRQPTLAHAPRFARTLAAAALSDRRRRRHGARCSGRSARRRAAARAGSLVDRRRLRLGRGGVEGEAKGVVGLRLWLDSRFRFAGGNDGAASLSSPPSALC